MKRLIKRSEYEDAFLGNEIEIIKNKSKYLGFRGWVDGQYHEDMKNHIFKYKIFLNPAAYENTDKPHIIYVELDNIDSWVRLLPREK